MNLDDQQRKKVAGWIEDGLKLAEIQKRIETEFSLRVTYLEVRLLVDDLKLKPKDPVEPVKPPAPAPEEIIPEPAAPVGGKVSVTVDQLTRPGALVSGKVRFTDGKSADWVLDQTGRLGIVPGEKGYKPTTADLQDFQAMLQMELQKLGL